MAKNGSRQLIRLLFETMPKWTLFALWICIGVLGSALIALWGQTLSIPADINLKDNDEPLGLRACAQEDAVKRKLGTQVPPALSSTEVRTLFVCRLYRGLGYQTKAIRYAEVTFQGDRLRAEAVVDLGRIEGNVDDYPYPLGSPGPTLLSQLAFKLHKIPFLGRQRVWMAIEGEPVIQDRNFVFYSSPEIEIGNWQLSLSQTAQYFRIPVTYLKEWLVKEYSALPMEPEDILIKQDRLELIGSPQAW